jgi:hypothetical protein
MVIINLLLDFVGCGTFRSTAFRTHFAFRLTIVANIIYDLITLSGLSYNGS